MKFATLLLIAPAIASAQEVAEPTMVTTTAVEPTMVDTPAMTEPEAPVLKEPRVSTFTFKDENKTGWERRTYNPNTNSTTKESLREIFDNEFSYAFEGHRITDLEAENLPECVLDTECGNGGRQTQCCVRSVLKHKVEGTNDVYYRCMSKAVAEANVTMSIGPMDVNMQCIGSGAKQLLATASALTLAALTLY